MTSFLKQISVALGLLTSDQSPIADADGWSGYVWRVRSAAECRLDDKDMCEVVHDKWDWKRDQWYRFAFTIDPAGNSIQTRLSLENNDPQDQDKVCIVAIFTDHNGDEVAVFYQNWPAPVHRTIDRMVPIRPTKQVSLIENVVVGSKQCQGGSPDDARNFYRLKVALRQK